METRASQADLVKKTRREFKFSESDGKTEEWKITGIDFSSRSECNRWQSYIYNGYSLQVRINDINVEMILELETQCLLGKARLSYAPEITGYGKNQIKTIGLLMVSVKCLKNIRFLDQPSQSECTISIEPPSIKFNRPASDLGNAGHLEFFKAQVINSMKYILVDTSSRLLKSSTKTNRVSTMLQENGHMVIYNPPNSPFLYLIERFGIEMEEHCTNSVPEIRN
ncbi:hypothetical protein RF11_11567 [Thelohanellus kitauei]|uniref:Uncharacterized protein n=1 Tax=Thelohanellus kitauei TaxID=669202 RepID=A0A0C2J7W3_THEKT|nr:hypothetical protein RF11_11567 [Thelohanellus kitauei]